MSKIDELIDKLCPDGVEFKVLEEICNILDNKRKPVTKTIREKGEYPYYGANGIQDYVSDYIFDGEYVLVGEDGSVVNKNGTPVVNWAKGKIWVNNHAHIIEEKEGVLLRFLFHYLQTVNVAYLIHGNIPKLTGKDFRAIKIPVPPLEVQREIVRVLDNFTMLTTELTTELAKRKKQYEYYRDDLLSFDVDIPKKKLGE
ncbi:MAG: restriction endonuclease subunit S, partial [Bacteroidetes bacterium]|nr:restriction endonuclease subunit S [Bacteroidota bacterium]